MNHRILAPKGKWQFVWAKNGPFPLMTQHLCVGLLFVILCLLLLCPYLGVPPVLRVGPLQPLVDGARRRPDHVAQEVEEGLRLGRAGAGAPVAQEPVQLPVPGGYAPEEWSMLVRDGNNYEHFHCQLMTKMT